MRGPDDSSLYSMLDRRDMRMYGIPGHCVRCMACSASKGGLLCVLTRTVCLPLQPRGVNIQPTLIAIAPTGRHAGDEGVQVAPYGIAVTGK